MPRWEALAPVAQAYNNYLKAQNDGQIEQANHFADQFYKQAQTAATVLGIQSDAEKIKQQRKMAPYEVQRLQMQTESLSEDVKEKQRKRAIHEEIARKYNVPIELVENEAQRLDLKQKSAKVQRELELGQPELAAKVGVGALEETIEKQQVTKDTGLIPKQVKSEAGVAAETLQRQEAVQTAGLIPKRVTADVAEVEAKTAVANEDKAIADDMLNQKLLQAKIEKLQPGATILMDEAIAAAGGDTKLVSLLQYYAKTKVFPAITGSLSRIQSLRMAIGLLDKGASTTSLLSYLPGRDVTGIQGSTAAGAKSYLSNELVKEKSFLKAFGIDYDKMGIADPGRAATRITPSATQPPSGQALEAGIGETNVSTWIPQITMSKGIEPELAMAIMKQEHAGKDFNPQAKGSANDVGLYQLTPKALADIGYHVIVNGKDIRLDPKVNILLGIEYIGKLKNDYGNQTVEDIAMAYNAGPDKKGRKGKPVGYAANVRRYYDEYKANPSLLQEDYRKLQQAMGSISTQQQPVAPQVQQTTPKTTPQTKRKPTPEEEKAMIDALRKAK